MKLNRNNLFFRILFSYNDLFVFFINIFIIALSFFLAILAHKGINYSLQNVFDWKYLYCLIFIILIKLILLYFFKALHGIWRYISLHDIIKIFFATFSASLIILILYICDIKYFRILNSALITSDFLFCFFFLGALRTFVRLTREYYTKKNNQKSRIDQVQNVLLVGKLNFVDNLLHSFAFHRNYQNIIGVITDENYIGKRIRDIPVLGNLDKLKNIVEALSINELLLLPPFTTPSTINEILDKFEDSSLAPKLKMVPDYADIVSGNINFSMIKNVEVEDLLDRDPITFDDKHVKSSVSNRNIMITGAGGSIGSELVRQVYKYNPKLIVLFDSSEFNLYNIGSEVESFKNVRFIRILANVTDRTAVLNAIKENNIDIVFHAAAVKHVPLLEENIAAALKTNLLGTSIVANCCEEAEVKKMVFISTDKAVNPTSIMGATKRLAERIITERVYKSTAFVVVRFGNVLGSSGSVVPRFKKQIEDGGPLTVTSKNITRFFMSIPEAVNLVLQAGSIGKNGNIMVLQMGNSIKIYELAKKLIELSGFRPEIDIRIKFTGLRPGEKEYEELLTEKEKVNNTIYDKIFISKFVPHGNEPIDLDTVINLIKERNLKKIKIYLKKQIPEALFN